MNEFKFSRARTGSSANSTSWIWVKRLFLIAGGASLIIVLFFIVQDGFTPYALIFLAPGIGAIVAYWLLRVGNVSSAWWVGLIVAVPSTLLTLRTSANIPVIRPVEDLLDFLSPEALIYFLLHISYLMMVVAGLWGFIALAGGLATSPTSATSTPRQNLFDADGNPVTLLSTVGEYGPCFGD